MKEENVCHFLMDKFFGIYPITQVYKNKVMFCDRYTSDTSEF